MKIVIQRPTNRLGKVATRKQDAIIRSTVRDVCSLIMQDEISQSIEIQVKLLWRMQKNQLGVCAAVSKHKYRITIDARLDAETFVTTLVHELVHVNQFAQGRLCGNSDTFFWYEDLATAPKKYKIKNHTHEQYLDWPWEREARCIEVSYTEILSRRKIRR